jgi:M6 family metalloprotease-like protein
MRMEKYMLGGLRKFRFQSRINLILIFSFVLTNSLITRVDAAFDYKCPDVTGSRSISEINSDIYGFYDSFKQAYFVRLEETSNLPTTRGKSVIGCYVREPQDGILTGKEAQSDVGVIARDETSIYWQDLGGTRINLVWDSINKRFLFQKRDKNITNSGSLDLDFAFNESDSSTCKLKDRTGLYFGPGFSKTQLPTWGKSTLKYKVVIPEFEQVKDVWAYEKNPKIDISETYKKLELQEVIDFYKTMSDGKVNLIFKPFTLKSKIAFWPKYYETLDSQTRYTVPEYSYTQRFSKQIIDEVKKSEDGSLWDGIIVALPKEYKYGSPGWHAKLNEITGDDKDADHSYIFINTGFHVNASEHLYANPPQNWIEGAESTGMSPTWRGKPWKAVAHELGHAFGFPDIYATFASGKKSISDNDGETAGPFDIMSGLTGGLEFNFWHRWLAGWLSDNQVICMQVSNKPKSTKIASIASTTGGIKGVVIPLSRTSALLVESRLGEGYDADLVQPKANSSLVQDRGLVVYAIDVRFPNSMASPLRVLSKSNLSGNFLNDYFRFLKAPLSPGDFLTYGNITLVNTGKIQSPELTVFESDSILLEQIQREVMTKLKFEETTMTAAELKAKQEAEAKAAAKAAAELRAKLEAEAKAAAELKAKQEAEARAKAEAAKKKISITCIKGKLTKKVTAINPKCPAGYRKK